MDTQLLLIFILALLTVGVLFLCFYAVLVLKELRVTIKKLNLSLDNVNSLTNFVSNPLPSLISAVSSIVRDIRSLREKTSESEEFSEEN